MKLTINPNETRAFQKKKRLPRITQSEAFKWFSIKWLWFLFSQTYGTFQNISIKSCALRMGHVLYENTQLLQELLYQSSCVASRTLIASSTVHVSRRSHITPAGCSAAIVVLSLDNCSNTLHTKAKLQTPFQRISLFPVTNRMLWL